MNLANVVFLVSLDRNVEGLSTTPSPSRFPPAPMCVLLTAWSPSQRAPAQAPLQGPQLLPGIFSSTGQIPSGLCTGCSFLLAMAAWRRAKCVCRVVSAQHSPLHGCSEIPASPRACRRIAASNPRAPPPPPPLLWLWDLQGGFSPCFLSPPSFLSLSTAVHTYTYHRHNRANHPEIQIPSEGGVSCKMIPTSQLFLELCVGSRQHLCPCSPARRKILTCKSD